LLVSSFLITILELELELDLELLELELASLLLDGLLIAEPRPLSMVREKDAARVM
jgi:hypothetical protein